MYIPPLFHEHQLDVVLAAIARYPLATLVTLGSEGLRSSQIPLLYSAREGTLGVLRGHFARANPQWRDLNRNTAALAMFHGPQHYISPSWFPSKSEHGMVVPTWNYVAIEARGPMKVIEDRAQILSIVRDLTESQERQTANPWSVDDAPPGYIDKMLNSIIGVEIVLESLEGKWKMSQNRSENDRAGVVAALKTIGSSEALDVAELVGKL
jgi:transcriptional regulator